MYLGMNEFVGNIAEGERPNILSWKSSKLNLNREWSFWTLIRLKVGLERNTFAARLRADAAFVWRRNKDAVACGRKGLAGRHYAVILLNCVLVPEPVPVPACLRRCSTCWASRWTPSTRAPPVGRRAKIHKDARTPISLNYCSGNFNGGSITPRNTHRGSCWTSFSFLHMWNNMKTKKKANIKNNAGTTFVLLLYIPEIVINWWQYLAMRRRDKRT